MSAFGIATLRLGAGHLGICPMPGRGGLYAFDLATLIDWRPALVLTMTTEAELLRGGAATLADDLASRSIEWRHLPVPDFGAPPDETSAAWPEVSGKAHALLASGGRVLAHCWGGCGRSGMALLRLMTEAGEPPGDALDRLRAIRLCAVETEAQQAWASAR